MKLKSFNNRWLKFITCYCLLYTINLPQVLKYRDPEILFKTNILIILDIFVISCLSTFIPCIHYLNKGEKLDEKLGKKICFYNTLLILAVGLLSSIFMVKIYGYYFLLTTIIGSIVYYFINMIMFVDYTPKNNCITNIISYILVVATVLIILFIGINFMRSSIDPPNYRIEESSFSNEVR
jgi:hypothetical protein